MADTQSTQEMTGETFTDRCRRMLNEQPAQREFTLSRAGLETIVRDAELYAERNAREVRQVLEDRERSERLLPKSLKHQIEDVREKWPSAELVSQGEGKPYLVKVPGVRRDPKIWKNPTATVYLVIWQDFPGFQPERFLTSEDDTLLVSGRKASNILGARKFAPHDLLEWRWAIKKPKMQHTLIDHINVARLRFEFGAACERDEASHAE